MEMTLGWEDCVMWAVPSEFLYLGLRLEKRFFLAAALFFREIQQDLVSRIQNLGGHFRNKRTLAVVMQTKPRKVWRLM